MLLDDQQIRAKCHVGEGSRCCRYLTMGIDRFECEANGVFKRAIDKRAMSGYMTARSGPCADPSDPHSEATPYEQA